MGYFLVDADGFHVKTLPYCILIIVDELDEEQRRTDTVYVPKDDSYGDDLKNVSGDWDIDNRADRLVENYVFKRDEKGMVYYEKVDKTLINAKAGNPKPK